MSEKTPLSCRMNKVGGQAVLDGVMMKGGENVAISVRGENGQIITETKKYVSVRKKHKILNIPILRGAVNMVEMLILSYSTLEKSAEMLGIDEYEDESKFDKWLREKLGDNLMSVIMGIAMVLGVALALFLFKFMPTFIASLIDKVLPLGWFRNLVEGLIKIALFVAYIFFCSLIPDIKRTFEYHGAEHKSIACYEAEAELIPSEAKKYCRFHPRCGTSFIFVILILSIIINSFITWSNLWARLGLQLLLLPINVGLSFEFIMYAGKHQNILTDILSAPGLWMQRITTREPNEQQLEVAIRSLKAALPDEFPPEEDSAEDKADDEANGEVVALDNTPDITNDSYEENGESSSSAVSNADAVSNNTEVKDEIDSDDGESISQ